MRADLADPLMARGGKMGAWRICWRLGNVFLVFLPHLDSLFF